MNETEDRQKESSRGRTFVEEIEIAGNQLVERVKELLQESNTRRVIITMPNGDELLSIPLTLGVVVGGLVTLSAPLVAALGAVAAFVSKVKLKVIREVDEDSEELDV